VSVDWSPLLLSLQIASLAMIVSLVVGTALALGLSWRRLPARDLFDALVSAPLVLPPTVLGYYLLVLLGNNNAIGRAWHWLTGGSIVFTFGGAVIAASVGSVPFVVRAVRVGLAAVDPALIAAARTLGARRWRVLVTIVLPLAAPGMVAGAMLAFARALGDYGITQMVAGQLIHNTETASIHVVNALYVGDDAAARDLALVTTVVGVGLLYLANRVTRRFERRWL
jgi:molybdate transport system permease protein